MGDFVEELLVRLGIDVDEKTLKAASKNIAQMADEMSGLAFDAGATQGEIDALVSAIMTTGGASSAAAKDIDRVSDAVSGVDDNVSDIKSLDDTLREAGKGASGAADDVEDLSDAMTDSGKSSGFFGRSLDKLKSRARDFGDEVEQAREEMRGFDIDLAGIAAAATTAATVISGAVGAMVVGFAQAGAEIDVLAKLANTSTETLQRNAAAANTVGVQTEELAQAYKDMGDRVGDFIQTGGGPMADFFENIGPKVGVTAEMFRELSGPDALQLFYDSLDQANLSQSEMTFYLEAMAGDLTKLQPLLANNGAEMKRLGDAAAATGAIMDEDGIKAAAQLGEEMSLAGTTITGLRNTIAQELAPTIIEIIKSFREFIAENRELISLGIVRLFDAARFALKALSVAAAVFLSYKLGLAVMGIGKAVIFLRNAFTAARVAALLLNASVLLIPTLIGAALIGLGLLFEDVMVFLEGGESAIGLLIAKFPALEGVVRGAADVFSAWWDQIKLVWDLLGALFSGDFAQAGDIFRQLIDNGISALQGMIGTAGEIAENIVGALLSPFPGFAEGVQAAIGFVVEMLQNMVAVVVSLLTGDWGGAANAFSKITAGWADSVMQFVSWLPNKIKGVLGEVGGYIANSAIGRALGFGDDEDDEQPDSQGGNVENRAIYLPNETPSGQLIGGLTDAALGVDAHGTPLQQLADVDESFRVAEGGSPLGPKAPEESQPMISPFIMPQPAPTSIAASAGAAAPQQTTVTQTDARVFNINGADTGMVKKILREDNAYAAKSIDTGYEY